MPTLTQLTSGLGGAIGSDFRAAQNQLIFVQFDTGTLSALSVAPATPGIKVLGTGYNQPEDVKLSVDGVHAYVTERTGDLVRVALTSANRSAATVIATGMTAPQQLFLDEAHNAAYVVQFAAAGSLLKINLTTGAKTVVAGGLNNPVGVVLSSDLQFAYVSEQTTGPDLGRISRIQMSTAGRTTLAKGFTSPFFLTWANGLEDELLFPQRDPADSIVRVNAITGASSVVAGGLPFRPSSVALASAGQLLVCCDAVIEEVNFVSVSAGAPLLIGVGLIPASSVTGGLATTPAGSLYQVTNAPFGGSLPIMVNFQAAVAAGAPFYQIEVDGVVQTNTWNVFKWNPTAGPGGTGAYVLTPVAPQTIGGTPGCYPVVPTADLALFNPAFLGGIVDTAVLASGSAANIVIQLVNSTGGKLTGTTGVSAPLTILVDNQPCVASLSPAVVNITPPPVADACGVLHYGAGTNKATTTVSFPLTASQPNGHATFSFTLTKGVTPVTVTAPTNPLSGNVPAASPINAFLSDLLGTCPTAGIAAVLYVAATMTNGLSRQSQYDAEAVMGLVLTA